MRSSKMGIEDMKSAHKLSHQKVAEWLRTAENLLKDNTTILDISAPSYGHFLVSSRRSAPVDIKMQLTFE